MIKSTGEIVKFSVLAVLVAVFMIASCHKDVNYVPANPPSNVLILGNSITFSPADPSLGWTGNWGMAASSADKDYVHILTANFKQQNAAATVTAMNIAAFERGYGSFNLDSAFSAVAKTKPDLLIIRIGENVAVPLNATVFDAKYQALINYFKAANPNVKVLGAGSFWLLKDDVDAEMAKYSNFISLSYLLKADITTEAIGLYPNPAVQQHPSDKGMSEIAQAIWNKVLTIE